VTTSFRRRTLRLKLSGLSHTIQ